MRPPPELQLDQALPWSTGTGTKVWAMLSAAAAGDLAAIDRLAVHDPSLLRCHHEGRTPLECAVRGGHFAVAEYLAIRTPNPLGRVGDDALVDVARDRGHTAIAAML
ncbi:MAG: ankyrin repeat domain-containing protein, partial [Gemmatimonadota bacterium]